MKCPAVKIPVVNKIFSLQQILEKIKFEYNNAFNKVSL